MTEEEIKQKLLDGEKIGIIGGDAYIRFDKKEMLLRHTNGYTCAFSDFPIEHYFPYKEPKKKIKKTFWKYWFISYDGILCDTNFCDTKDKCIPNIPKNIKGIDWESKTIEMEEN